MPNVQHSERSQPQTHQPASGVKRGRPKGSVNSVDVRNFEGKYVIQEGIPFPEKRRGRQSPFQFDKMEVGESIFVPDRNEENIYSTIYSAGKKLGRKFIAANEVDEEGVEGVRVWRFHDPEEGDEG
jgi:hypothetical protein